MNAIIQLVDLNKKTWQLTLLVFLALIWGSSFILMKKGLNSFTYMQVAAFRMAISFFLLIPFIAKRIKRVKSKHILPLVINGIIGYGIPAFLFTKAQTNVSSSIAGVLNSLTPLFALIVGYIIFKVKFSWQNTAGITLGLVGATILIIYQPEQNFEITNLYPLLIVMATICYAFAINVVKEKLADLDGLTIAAISFFFIGPFCTIYLFFSDYTFALSQPDLVKNFSYIFLLALFSSVIAIILFNYLIKFTTALFASSVTYVIPVVAILWGVLDGESILDIQYLAISIILIGVYLVNKKKKRIEN